MRFLWLVLFLIPFHVFAQSQSGPAPCAQPTATCASPAILFATTSSIGGGSLAAGACASGTASMAGVGAGMAVLASPQSDPGAGYFASSLVTSAATASAPGTVTVRVCNGTGATGTPTASLYNVRVLP